MSALVAPIAACVFVIGLVRALVGDLTSMTIRNSLVLFLVSAYLIFAPLVGIPVGTITKSAGAALLVLAGGFALFLRGGIGGGDVKLASAIVLWLGAEHTLAYLVCVALFGGILTAMILVFRRLTLPAGLASTGWLVRLHAHDAGVPYGVALTLAALALLPATRWIT